VHPARAGRVLLRALVCALLPLGAAACTDDGGSTAAGPGTGTDGDGPTTGGPTTGDPGPATEARPLRVLVTNDDGVGAPGLDAVVQALLGEPGVEVVVVAPATDQSGSGDRTTDGPLVATPATTLGGYEATAVDGTPADSVVVALERLDPDPDLVVSGSNRGQNIGPAVTVSGTVGAARTAARRGIPAIAVSQGIAETPDYATGTRLLLEWLRAHRAELADGPEDGEPAMLTNLNVPTCPSGEVRGVIEVPVATDLLGRDPLTVDCVTPAETWMPADDIGAFIVGYAPLSTLEP
jgi:5'-nucleotidase